MKKKYSCILILFLIITGCSNDNPVTPQNEVLIFERLGIIESFGGDCSAVQVRTGSLGNYDLSNYNNLIFKFLASTDADLSSISVFYISNGETVYLMNLNERDIINSTQSYFVNSPAYSGELFIRFTLKSSVCTGQIFHIEMRDLKIYSTQ